jgi:hypothetical protein
MAKFAPMTIPIAPIDRYTEAHRKWGPIIRAQGELGAELRGRLTLIEEQRGCSAWQPEGGAWLP